MEREVELVTKDKATLTVPYKQVMMCKTLKNVMEGENFFVFILLWFIFCHFFFLLCFSFCLPAAATTHQRTTTDLDDDQPIPVSGVTYEILEKLFEYCKHHQVGSTSAPSF